MTIWRALACVSLAAGIAFFSGGCQAKPAEGTVAGQVRFKNQPVTGALVQFYCEALGTAGEAQVDESGNYSLNNPVRVGTYKVSINYRASLPPRSRETKAAPRATLPNFNQKYFDSHTTPLEFEVKKGQNRFDIELKE